MQRDKGLIPDQRFMFSFGVILPVILLVFHVCSFAYSDWQNFDPGAGGGNQAIFCHPTDSNIVWVNTDLNGFYRSTNGGKHYTCATNQIQLETVGTGFLHSSLYQFALDPSDPGICYYAVNAKHSKNAPQRVFKNGVWKSTDKGATWSFCDGQPDSLNAASMVVDYNGNLYCIQNGLAKNFYVSTDKGKTFVKKSPLPFISAAHHKGHVVIAASKANWVYSARPYKNGLYYTTDQGNNWIAVDSFATRKVGSIACSPKNGGTVLVLTFTGEIWRSENGKNFVKTGKVTNKPSGRQLGGININGKGTVIASGHNGSRAISHDIGKTFSRFFIKPSRNGFVFNFSIKMYGTTMLAASPVSDRWYLTVGPLHYQSFDNGKSWKVGYKGVQIICVMNSVVVDVSNPNRVHAGAADVGYYYTPDLGASWKCPELTWADVQGLAQDPNNPKTFYRINGWYSKNNGGNNMVHKSTDGGAKWDQIGTWDKDSLKRAWGALVVDPTESKRLYFATYGRSDVYKSEDAGKSFSPMPGSPGNVSLMSITQNGNLFGLAGGAFSGTLMKYEKSFNKWHKIHSKLSGYAVHPKNQMVIFAAAGTHAYNCGSGTPGRLEKTTNGGTSWQVVKDAKGKDFHPWSVYIDPTNPDLMLMSTYHHFEDNGLPSGIMRSLDGGKTWHSINRSHGPTNMVKGFSYGGVKGRAYAWNGCGGGMSRIDNLHVAMFEGKLPVGLGMQPSTTLTPMHSGLHFNAANLGSISYSVESSRVRSQLVKLGIYDIQGRLVKMLVNQRQSAGSYGVNWNGSDGAGRAVSAGMRFYRLEAGDAVSTVKAVVR